MIFTLARLALLHLALYNATPIQRAAEDGYQPRVEEAPGSALAGLIALGPGLLLHGAGHYKIDRKESALKLLLIEALGLALIAAGEIIEEVSDGDGAYGWLSNGMGRTGALLFLGSWGADVLGAFKGDRPFEPDNTRLRSAQLSLAYRYTGDQLTLFRHHMSAALDLSSGWAYARPSVALEAGMNTRRADLDMGAYLLRGHWLDVGGDPHNLIALGGRLHRIETPLYGLGRRGGELYLKWKLDLGLLLPTMRALYIVNRAGYGFSQYQLSPTAGQVPPLLGDSDFTDSALSWESGVELNTGAQTHFSLLFIQDPNLETSPISSQMGVLEVALEHRYEDDLDIEARITGGDGWAIWLELGYQL
ncbi:hypothetical protein KKF91_20415 [Myxococcota bacterium]|nr:hypothetical protein [Myxococcota bacterium]MBU1432911.1 hypothetical protein [Myxococcota bacterium]MBU1900538.1 hypothetical protein [Myxococcota bacterium]